MPQVSVDDWFGFIEKHPDAHILQTAEWGELKAGFGWEPVQAICDGWGAQVLFRKLPFGLTVGYVPKPPQGILDSPEAQGLRQELAEISRRKRAILLKIEPDEWIGHGKHADEVPDPGFGAGIRAGRSPYNIQPPRTIVVDLRGTEEDILARMKQKCRYNIRLAEKKEVTVRPWDDIGGFHALMQATGSRDGFAVHSEAYYQRAHDLFHGGEKCELLVAEYQGQPLAALMVFRQGRRAWYLYGASNDLERNRMPTYLLQWEAMRWAKTRGCLEYDLWGVPDEDAQTLEDNFERRQDGLWGVYRFKRGFGGELRRSAQAIDIVLNPVLYRFYLWGMSGREAA